MHFVSNDTRAAIHRSFRGEFYKKAIAAEPGTDGSIARAMYNYEQWHKQNPLASLGVILCVTLGVGVNGALLIGGAGFFVGQGLLAAAIFAGNFVQRRVFAKADKEIIAGINDGSLVERYKNEVLGPEIKRLESVLTCLAEKGTLSANFVTAVVKEEGLTLPDAPTSELPRSFRR